MLGITVNRTDVRHPLELKEVEIPRPAAGELLIKVHAAAVNRTDIVARQGKEGYMTNPIIGVEVAGTVTEASGETGFKTGDRVMGLVNGGGYAEYAVMPAERAMKIPESFTFAEAAAIPEVFLTAYQTLFWIGKLRENESVLIHAGASGVGTAAIQLAKTLRNAKVIVTAGSREKLDFCQKLGADVLINYKEQQNFDEEVLKATEGQGVDVILDFVGADYWERNLNSIKKAGRWVLIGILGGSVVENVDLFPLMSKMIEITGTLLTPRDDDYKARLTRDFCNDVMPYFEKREIVPVVDASFPLEKAEDAHEHMLKNRNIGKIILEVSDR